MVFPRNVEQEKSGIALGLRTQTLDLESLNVLKAAVSELDPTMKVVPRPPEAGVVTFFPWSWRVPEPFLEVAGEAYPGSWKSSSAC